MKINKNLLSKIILEEIESLEEKGSKQKNKERQKRQQKKQARRKARKAKAASPKQGKPQTAADWAKKGKEMKKAIAKKAGQQAKKAGQQAKAAAKPASPKQQGKPQKEKSAKRTPEEVKAKAEAEQKKRDAQEAKFQQAAFGDKEEGGEAKQDKADPQAAAKEAAQQDKKTEKATTKTGLQAATGEKVDTDEQPEEIQKVSNEIQKLQKKLQSWANKAVAKVPKTGDAAIDKEAKLAILKIPMALKVANQNINKISKQDNEALQAVLNNKKPQEASSDAPTEDEELAAANRKEEDFMGYLRNLVREEVNECGGMPLPVHPSDPEKIRIVVGKRDEEDEEETLEVELGELLASELNSKDDK